MDAVNTATATATAVSSYEVDPSTVADILKGILSVAGGGIGAWIAAGVLILFAGVVAWWINKKIKDLQNATNDQKREANEGQTDPISSGGEQKWDGAAKKSDKDREENPDTGKTPLDPVE